MSKLKRVTIFILMIGVAIGSSIPQPLIAQVGDGTAGPSVTPPYVPPPDVGPNPGGDIEDPYVPPPGVGPNPGGDIEEPDGDDHNPPAGTHSDSPSDPNPYPVSSTPPIAQEPPIELEVLDCPGVVRTIDASHLPPSIYPKPNCVGGTPGAGTNGPTGVCTTDPNIHAYGTSQEKPPDDAILWTITGGEVVNITQGFGPTDMGLTGYYDNYNYTLNVSGHPGIDMGVEYGTPLYTPVAGKVIVDGGSGYFYDSEGTRYEPYKGEIRLELDNGDRVVFGHMSQIDVRVGDMVQAGQQVGLSGYVPGPHLHLEYHAKISHPQGEFTALDPRDVFGCASPSSTDTPAPPAEGTSGPQVQGAKTEKGQVLQANVTVAPEFAYFQEEYGLDPVTGDGNIDFEQYSQELGALRDHAVKAAPAHDIDPEIVVMWSVTETGPPYTSWEYSHCNDMGGIIDPGTICVNNNWQVGYGQQYVVYHQISEAWSYMYGIADSASEVQKVLQNSATMAGLSTTAPPMTAAELSTGSTPYWTMVMTRDQAISAYLLAYELKSDLQNAANNGYGNRLWDFACENGWGTDYCQGSEFRARFSNNLNAILLNWGRLGTGTTGSNEVCRVGASDTNSNCSTIEDNLNGMSVDEFVEKINENIEVYRAISECANVPWEMMAAIHLRETSLATEDVGAGGPWQFHPEPTDFDAHDFELAGCEAGKMLAGKIEEQFAGENIGPLRAQMDPSSKADEYSIKAAFFGYNGTGGWEPNVEKGCTPALDGNDKFNWDCSAYVMNNMDSNHTGMCVMGLDPSQEKDDEGPQLFCPPDGRPGNDGVWKVYFKLHYSTYDAEGNLLVYGGKCTTNNEVIDGFSAPTKPGLNINSQFFAPSHEGIDIANQENDPIFAIATGDIIISGWNDRGGYYLILHIEAQGQAPEMYVYYGHLKPGSFPEASSSNPVRVQAGQQIGQTGAELVIRPDGVEDTNGDTTGPHLHFDMRKTPNDPPTQEGHINPCILQVMRNSYPTLNCPDY